MAMTPAAKEFALNAAKEIIIKALETSNPLVSEFSVKEANVIGDAFNALAIKIAQSIQALA